MRISDWSSDVCSSDLLQTPDGKTVQFPEDARHQPSVLLFWPSWCPYSRALQPYVQDIWNDYRDAGVQVWTINIQETGDAAQAMHDPGLSLPLLLYGDALIQSYGQIGRASIRASGSQYVLISVVVVSLKKNQK